MAPHDGSTCFFINPSYSAKQLHRFFDEKLDKVLADIVRQRPYYADPNKWVEGSPYEDVFQHENAVVAIYDIPADAGRMEVDGIDVSARPREALARMGVLSDARGLYPRLTARENIVYYARLHGMSDALTFSGIERQPVVPGVDRNAPMEPQGILAEQRIDGAGFRQCERCGVGHVRVQHDRMASDPMNRCVNEKRSWFCPMPAFKDLAPVVHEQDVIGKDLAPVQATRVEQEPVSIHGHAEVVADAFRKPMPCGGPQGQREIFSE